MRFRRTAVALLALTLTGCTSLTPHPTTPSRPPVTTPSPVIPGPPTRAPIHATVAGGCPPAISPMGDVIDSDVPITGILPDHAPDSGLICLYRPAEKQTIARLADSRRLDRAAARSLTVTIRGLTPRGPGVYNCPADIGGYAAVLAFHYPHGDDFDLWDHDSGCGTLDNGSTTLAATLPLPGGP